MSTNQANEHKAVSDLRAHKGFTIGTYAVLGLVSAVMTALNVLTGKGFLTYCTGIFAFLCLINIVLALSGEIPATVARILFAVEVVLMFTYFLISGEPDGFSAIWICMLPSLGMIFFNRVRGTFLCAVMFVILVLVLWLPVGQMIFGEMLYQYNDTFRMRFPILFVAFHALAFFVETLRQNAYKEMRRLQEHYRDLSAHDPLTGLYNRQGMFSILETDARYEKSAAPTGIAIFDIDDFKIVNDRHGHNAGDEVLRRFAKVVSEELDATVCRWGGEEFLAVFDPERVSADDLQRCCTRVSGLSFDSASGAFGITVSVGVCTDPALKLEAIDSLIFRADAALYQAKTQGKNRVIVSDMA